MEHIDHLSIACITNLGHCQLCHSNRILFFDQLDLSHIVKDYCHLAQKNLALFTE